MICRRLSRTILLKLFTCPPWISIIVAEPNELTIPKSRYGNGTTSVSNILVTRLVKKIKSESHPNSILFSMSSLEYIINHSGDSILRSHLYSEGVLIINLELTELDRQIKLRIKTEDMSFDNRHAYDDTAIYKTCRIEIQALDILSQENGIYIPPNTFGKLMRESRLNYHLAYGKKSSDLKYIFSLRGYYNLVSCLISDLDAISIFE